MREYLKAVIMAPNVNENTKNAARTNLNKYTAAIKKFNRIDARNTGILSNVNKAKMNAITKTFNDIQNNAVNIVSMNRNRSGGLSREQARDALFAVWLAGRKWILDRGGNNRRRIGWPVLVEGTDYIDASAYKTQWNKDIGVIIGQLNKNTISGREKEFFRQKINAMRGSPNYRRSGNFRSLVNQLSNRINAKNVIGNDAPRRAAEAEARRRAVSNREMVKTARRLYGALGTIAPLAAAAAASVGGVPAATAALGKRKTPGRTPAAAPARKTGRRSDALPEAVATMEAAPLNAQAAAKQEASRAAAVRDLEKQRAMLMALNAGEGSFNNLGPLYNRNMASAGAQ